MSEVNDGESREVERLLEEARQIEAVDQGRARVLVQQARSIAHASGDRAGEARALYRLASNAYYAGRSDEALAIAAEARDLAVEHGPPEVEAWALNLIGIVQLAAGNYDEALANCVLAVERRRATDGEKHDLGNMINAVASVYQALGDVDRALVQYEEALEENRGLDLLDFDAITLANMAQLRRERGEHLPAISLAARACQLARDHVPSVLPEVMTTLAEGYLALGDVEQARALLDEALALLEVPTSAALASAKVRAVIHKAIGQCCRTSGQLDEALDHLSQALELATLANAKAELLQVHQDLATTYKALGRFEEALAHQEARYAVNQQLFKESSDMRIRTLQVAHDAEQARRQAQMVRLRTTELDALVQGRTSELESFQLAALERLAALAEGDAPDDATHHERVGDLAADLAARLGESEVWCERLRQAARLHDIGKVGIPDHILHKPGPLTPDEQLVVQRHTSLGGQILSGSASPLIQLAEEIATNHHEHWDGSGYHRGLRGTEIPLSARIVAVADVYDALVTARPHKHAWTADEAVRYVLERAGSQFDPDVVEAFAAFAGGRHPELTPLLETYPR